MYMPITVIVNKGLTVHAYHCIVHKGLTVYMPITVIVNKGLTVDMPITVIFDNGVTVDAHSCYCQHGCDCV